MSSFGLYPMPHAGLLMRGNESRRSSSDDVVIRPSPYEIEDRELLSMFELPRLQHSMIKTSNSKPNGVHMCLIGEIPGPRIISPNQGQRSRFASSKARNDVKELKQSRAMNKVVSVAQKQLKRMPLATLTFDSRAVSDAFLGR